jgi:DNA-binding MarR family transcriptional regulator
MLRIMQRISTQAEQRLRQHGLSAPAFNMLRQIASDEGLTQQELSENLSVSKGNISQMIEKLEHSGLIVRQQEGTSKFLFLTEQGRTLLGVMIPEHDSFMTEMFRALTPDEQAQLHALLRKVDKSLD